MQKRKVVLKEFVESLTKNGEVEFFGLIKKIKWRTFATMKKTTKNKVENNVIPIESHSIFGRN